MKYNKIATIFAFIIVISASLYSKDYELPENYVSLSESNLKQFEPEILKCIDYLENAPQDDVSDRKKRINSFFMEWVTLSPTVSIKIQPYLIALLSHRIIRKQEKCY